MHIILSYDVRADRTGRFKKSCQIFLTRIQNSVFEGDINEAQLMRLEKSMRDMAEDDESVRIWVASKILKNIKIGISEEENPHFI